MSKINDLIREYCPNGVEYKELGELGVFYSGLSGKSKKDFENGNCKFITYINIYKNPSLNINIQDKVFIKEEENQNNIQYGDILFTGSSKTPDECGISSVVTNEINEKIYLNSFCFGYRLDDKNIFLPNFLKHLFRSDELRKKINKTASGVTRYNVSKIKFAKNQIPLPPLQEQERIVKILDKFDDLINNISKGIPAELESRRKQYEYYRNKLLTFKEME